MTSNLLIIGIVLIILAGFLCGILLRIVFKKSIVFKIGAVFLSITDAIACQAFLVGMKGIFHLIWAVPLSILLLFLGYYWLSAKVQKPISTLTNSLFEISEGNLKVNLTGNISRRNDELGQITQSVENLTERIRNIIVSVNEAANSLLHSSKQILESSQQLSEGANEQASLAEEVSSSVEEMAANISQNSENAQTTEVISEKASKSIINTTALAGESSGKMNRIKEEVRIIQDIAFQTNILALNAAVEAARAGDAGKGFAVVASEVRKLAERSKTAAEKIDVITTDGVNTIQTVEKEMRLLVPEIEKTAQLVKEITSASMEQNAGADQINSAIQQLSTYTQQSAASSEELASSSEELNVKSTHLKELMNYFSI